MKEFDVASSLGVDARQVCPLVPVAMKTREGQVPGNCTATVNARNNVVNFKRKIVARGRYLAVFTTALGTLPDAAFEFTIHVRLTKPCGALSELGGHGT